MEGNLSDFHLVQLRSSPNPARPPKINIKFYLKLFSKV